jgi:hypothetical protein
MAEAFPDLTTAGDESSQSRPAPRERGACSKALGTPGRISLYIPRRDRPASVEGLGMSTAPRRRFGTPAKLVAAAIVILSIPGYLFVDRIREAREAADRLH